MTWRMDDFSDEDTDVIDDENFDTGKIFSKVKLSLVISTTFEFPAKKWTPNYLKMAHFKLSQIENDGFLTTSKGQNYSFSQI